MSKKNERKGIPKKIRFEVFKRDSFTCQYCGKKSPDVILEVDHINPIKHGGDGDIMNLVTACEDCNAGKSGNLISDDSALQKQRKQIETLQLRREQLDMMLEWRESLLSLNDYETDRIVDFIHRRIAPFTIKDTFKTVIASYKKKWGIITVLESVEVAANQYLKMGEDGVSEESVYKMLEKLPGVCFNSTKYNLHPELKIIDSIRFNTLAHQYVNVWQFYALCNEAMKQGMSAEHIKDASENAKNWTDWKKIMTSLTKTSETPETETYLLAKVPNG